MPTATVVRGMNPGRLRGLIREGTEFDYGRLHGETGKVDFHDALPQAFVLRYKKAKRVRYSVTSHDHLIGWVEKDGTWVIPDYSPAGSEVTRHQELLKQAAGA